jgi:hypothetical protein
MISPKSMKLYSTFHFNFAIIIFFNLLRLYLIMHRALLFCFLLFFLYLKVNAQFNVEGPSEMAIPSAPAFSVLGVNPEIVMRPSDIKSIKVDWRIKNYNLAPDLALEAQPFWQLFYKNKDMEEYLNARPIAHKLSSMSFSLATAKIDGINHAAYAFKVNLYKEKLPEIENEFRKIVLAEASMKLLDIDSLIQLHAEKRLATTDPNEKEALTQEIEELYEQRYALSKNTKEEYLNRISQTQALKWNISMLDFAFGRVMTYDNGGIDKLKLQGAGYALWFNGCVQSGENGLFTGLIRYSNHGSNSNIQLGMSYRYGGPKFNLFVETIYERLGNFFDTGATDPFDQNEVFASKYEQDIGSSWLHFNPDAPISQYTLSYGGDFKLSKNILLNFALRTQFGREFSFTRLLPVANVVCLMN